MRKKIREVIEIGDGINANIEEGKIKIEKNDRENEKKLPYPIKKEGNKIVIENKSPTKRDKKLIKTTAAIIRSMISGLEQEYEYKLKIASVHFPVNVSVKGNNVIIKNFLGETIPRQAKILPGADVKIEKDIITVKSHDKEKAGQTAANIEKASKVKDRDRRVFQDGIFITKKEKGRRK